MKECTSTRIEGIILPFYEESIEIDKDKVKNIFEAYYKHKFLVQYTNYVEIYNTIFQMNKREVQFIYEKFFDTTLDGWTDKFVEELNIYKYRCFENTLFLNEIGELINQTLKMGNISFLTGTGTGTESGSRPGTRPGPSRG